MAEKIKELIDIKLLHEDATLKIAAHHEPSIEHRKVLLSFTGIGHEMGGVPIQKNEFIKAGMGFDNIFFISDLTRSWGNAINFDLIRQVVLSRESNTEVFAIGNSMGGFLAVCASQYIPISVVLAFSSQFSVDKQIVPEENRWQGFISRIENFKIPSLEHAFQHDTLYYMISGSNAEERIHWNRFPQRANIYNIVLNGGSHHMAQELKARAKLDFLIQKCFMNELSLDALKQVNPGGVLVR